MRKTLLLLALALLGLTPAQAANNAVIITPGVGVTIRCNDVGTGIQSCLSIPGDTSGNPAWGTAGAANANILTVQGIAAMTPLLVTATQSGAWTVAPTSAPAWGINTLGSTTSGQSGVIALGAVTTAAPTYTTAQSNALSLDTAGNLRVNVVTGGAGGGAVTVADGADVAEGAKADTVCATDTGTCSVVALLKRNNSNVSAGSGAFGSAMPASGIAIGGTDGTNMHSFGAALVGNTPAAGTYGIATAAGNTSYADGWDVTQGAKADAVCGTATGTCSEIALTKFIASAVSGAIPAGTNNIGSVNSVANATGGATPTFIVAANSNNSTNVKASAGTVYGIQLGSIGAAPAFLKLYDKATAPTCGTDTPVAVFIIPAASTAANGGGSNVSLTVGKKFTTGIGYCVVTGIANNDNTSVAAATFLINIDWN